MGNRELGKGEGNKMLWTELDGKGKPNSLLKSQ